MGYGSKKYPPGKKWYYNGVPLKKQRFNESSGTWYQLDEEEEDIGEGERVCVGRCA